MNKILYILILTAALIPLSLRADVTLTGGWAATNDFAADASLVDVAAATDDAAFAMDYYVFWDQFMPTGEGLAATPMVAPTSAAQQAKTRHQLEAIRNQEEKNYNAQVKKATVINLSPKDIWAQVKALFSGDSTFSIRDQLENQWDLIKEDLYDEFTGAALADKMANLMQDIMSCNTPNLQALFPSLNIDLGLQMCDYKQMFDNVKGQVNNIASKDWGSNFTINGQPASQIIKDPSQLSSALTMVSPGQGHALVADFLSEDSRNVALQAKADTTALGQKMAENIRAQDYKRMFSDFTSVDALNSIFQGQAIATQGELTNEAAQHQIAVDTIELQRAQVHANAVEKRNNADVSAAHMGHMYASGAEVP